MDLKNNKKKVFTILAIIIPIVILSAIAAYLVLNKIENIYPEIGLMEIDDYTLIVNPSKKYQEQSNGNEQLVYCLNIEENSSTCSWQDSNKFQIEYDYTYYIYIKSLDTDLISEPEKINYSIPEYIE